MDASFFTELEVGEVDEVLGALDPAIGDVIRHLDGGSFEDVRDELIAKFSMKDLTDARTTLFRVAMDRIDYCLSQVAKARESTVMTLSEEDEETVTRAEKLFRGLDPKAMINRKCPKRLVKDMIDLVRFDSGRGSEFPTGMMRTIPFSNVDISIGITPDDIKCLKRVASIMLSSDEMSGADDFGCDVKDTDISSVSVDGGNLSINVPDISITHPSESEYDEDTENELTMEVRSDDESTCYREIDNQSFSTVDEKEDQEERCMSRKVAYVNIGDEDDEDERCDNMKARTNDNEISNGQKVYDKRSVVEMEGVKCDDMYDIGYVSSKGTDAVETEKQGAFHEEENEVPDNVNTTQTQRVEIGAQPSVSAVVKERQANLDKNNRDEPIGGPYANGARKSVVHVSGRNSQSADAICESEVKQTSKHERVGDEGILVKLIETILRVVENPPSNRHCCCDRIDRMAERQREDGKGEWKRGSGPLRRRHDPDHDGRMDALEEWRESFTSRTIDVEGAIMERFRSLQLENDEMAAEMRKMKRQIRELASERPVYVTPVILCREQRATVPVQGETKQPGEGVEVAGRRQNRRGEAGAAVRPRAASFGGRVAMVDCVRRNVQDGGKEASTTVDSRQRPVQNEAPKPQRETRGKRDQRGQSGGKVQAKPPENQLREWLAKAKRDEGPVAQTPFRAGAESPITTSPSWADADDSDEGGRDGFYSEMVTPTSTQDDADEGQTTPDVARKLVEEEHGEDDGCRIPPSGQITNPRVQRGGGEQRRGNEAPSYGGARPKAMGKQNMSKGSTNGQNQGGGRNGGQMYGKKGGNGNGGGKGPGGKKIVTRNGWTTVENKKRKYEKVSPRAASTLEGIPATVNRDVYLQGLRIRNGECEEDVMENVKAYCIERGITPVFVRNIPVKFDCTRTGCRLTVNEEDYERVILNVFWPENIRARDWTPKPKDNRDNEDFGDGPPSDEEE